MAEEETNSDAGEPEASDGPLVFISHDSRDATIAEALSNLLSNVTAGMLQTFRSSDKKGSQGFEYGTEWYPELMKRLEAACDVVCLLTKNSLHRPWILYEAGVAKGKLDIPVHGLALGVPLTKAVSGPFAQFQNCDDDVDSISKLVVQLVKRLPHASPNPTLVRQQVEEFVAAIEPDLAMPGAASDDSVDDDAAAKLFEEVKVMFQDLPIRIERLVAESSATSSPRVRHRPMQHPGVAHETMLTIGRGEPSVGLATMIGSAALRDDLPWLYDMAVAIYEASLAGDRAVERRAIQTFSRALDVIVHGPLAREIRSQEARLLLEDLSLMTDAMLPPWLRDDPHDVPPEG